MKIPRFKKLQGKAFFPWQIRHIKAGFSLLEVSFAVVIVSLVAISLFTAFAFGNQITRATRENMRASQILLERAETIRLYTWSQIVNSNYIPASWTNDYNPNSSYGGKGISYYSYFNIGAVPFTDASYSTNMRQFTITLRWTNASMPHVRQFTTYVGRYGMQAYNY
jgi:prepilin-type N-terminal cleavage/methylation domain-containing protein